MSFTVGQDGTKLVFHVRYDGPGNPEDVHIYLLDTKNPTLDHAKGIIGYPRIPEEFDPKKGFDIPYYPTPPNFPFDNGKIITGSYAFKLVWSFGGTSPDKPDNDTPSVFINGTPPPQKPWIWLQYVGWILAGALGSAIGGAILNWWTVVAILPCILTGALSGAIGSAIGQIISWFFDDPKINWTFKSVFLFSLFFSLVFSMILGLLAIGLEKDAVMRGESINRVTMGVGLIAGFLTPIFAGVLNNLRDGI